MMPQGGMPRGKDKDCKGNGRMLWYQKVSTQGMRLDARPQKKTAVS